jgi:hypothetical protein
MGLVAGSGSERLNALAVRLKVAGEKGLRTELLRGLKQGSDPLVKAVAAAAEDRLPHGGGLNVQVAGQKVKVQVRTGARTAGVRLTTNAPDTAQTDAGFVRHPVYGNRKKWITQQIPNAAGWWSQTLADGGPDVTTQLLAVMKSVSVQIQGGL